MGRVVRKNLDAPDEYPALEWLTTFEPPGERQLECLGGPRQPFAAVLAAERPADSPLYVSPSEMTRACG